MAKKQPNQKKTASNSNNLMLLDILVAFIFLGLSVILFFMSYMAFCFFILGMLPTIVAILTDKGRGKYAAKTIIGFNFMGVLPTIFNVISSKNHEFTAKEAVTDIYVWLFCYGIASLGWIFVWLMPQITLMILTARADAKIRKIQTIQEDLVEEWSGIKGG